MRVQYMERLNELAGRLPFHLDDVERVNAVFLRWHTGRESDDLKTLEIWVYCRAQWYVLKKLARDTQATPNDFDQLSSVVFTKLRSGMESVREPERFVNWVNVVCRNAYINERRKERPQSELNEETLADESAPALMEMDRAEIIRVIERAIDRLPPSLSGVGRMKLLENKSYEQISAATGLPMATARTYTAKVLARLREDPAVQEIVRDILPGLSGRLKGSNSDSEEA